MEKSYLYARKCRWRDSGVSAAVRPWIRIKLQVAVSVRPCGDSFEESGGDLTGSLSAGDASVYPCWIYHSLENFELETEKFFGLSVNFFFKGERCAEQPLDLNTHAVKSRLVTLDQLLRTRFLQQMTAFTWFVPLPLYSFCSIHRSQQPLHFHLVRRGD